MKTHRTTRLLNSENIISVFETLKYDVFNVTPEFPQGMDWYPVFCELRSQGILGFSEKTLEYIVKHNIFVPDEKSATLADTWKKRICQQRELTEIVKEKQDKLVALLKKKGEKFVIIKGFAASFLYEDYSCRKSGDIDFLVLPKRFDVIHEYLLENGFECTLDTDYRNNEYEFEGVKFEMHKRFSFYDTPRTEGKTADEYFYENLERPEILEINGSVFPSLSVQNMGICFLVHQAHHMVAEGMGFRHFLDWVMYADRYLSDDQWNDRFGAVAKEMGLDKFAAVMTRTAQLFFGLPLENRSWCQGVLETTCENLVRYMLEKGNYGIKAPETVRFFEVMNSADARKGAFVKLQSRGEVNWKLLKKHPKMRPFAWIYQIFRYIYKTLTAKNFIGNYFAAREQVRIIDSLIEDCGLVSWGYYEEEKNDEMSC